MTVRAARRIPDLKPGDREWMSRMTASKVAAVVGLSPWQSRFSLWHEMAGLIEHESGNTFTERGLYLEDAVCRWWGDQFVDLRVGKTGSWVNKARPWQSATPDRLIWSGRRVVGILEAKTSAKPEDWGPDGSDEIPPYYRAQLVWQMDCLGLPVAHLAALLSRLNFRAYVVHHDREEAEWLRGEAFAFLDSLPTGNNPQPPPIDSHEATYEAVRKLHPKINGEDAVIDLELARRFTEGIDLARVAKATEQAVKSEMADAMGDTRRAVVKVGEKEIVVATRQAKGNGVPYVSAPKKLPTLPEVAR